MVNQLNFNAERALDEVNADYATTTELADILQRDADVPFRVGHHFASDLVTYGRRNSLRPTHISFVGREGHLCQTRPHFGITNQLPLSEANFRRALTAENMVQSSLGLGGPQPSEVARMLAAQRVSLKNDREWLDSTRKKLDGASKQLDAAFAELKSVR